LGGAAHLEVLAQLGDRLVCLDVRDGVAGVERLLRGVRVVGCECYGGERMCVCARECGRAHVRTIVCENVCVRGRVCVCGCMWVRFCACVPVRATHVSRRVRSCDDALARLKRRGNARRRAPGQRATPPVRARPGAPARLWQVGLDLYVELLALLHDGLDLGGGSAKWACGSAQRAEQIVPFRTRRWLSAERRRAEIEDAAPRGWLAEPRRPP
jgi:hypothetical protein